MFPQSEEGSKMKEELAERYLILEIYYQNNKAACNILKEDGLALPKPWMTKEEEASK